MPNVSFTRKEVKERTSQYELIEDCLAGEQRVKYRRERYLPRPNASDTSPENAERYQSYITRALFYAVSQRTLAGLVGQIFLRTPQMELPTNLEILKDDATGDGVSLEQQAATAAELSTAFGRCGLWADYPDTAGPATKADLEAGNVRPSIHVFKPTDVINWRTIKRGAKELLSLVVIKRPYTVADDGFETKTETEYLVLRLEDDLYVIEVYRIQQGNAVATTRYEPRDHTGARLNEIPFTFVGSKNNNAAVDEPPMYPLCSVNIAHYRNSADYEESCHITGQPTPYFAGLTQAWVDDVLKGTIQLGARGAVPLPEGGSAGLIQAEPNTMPAEAMKHKEAMMLALGAKLVEGSQTQRTATEADHDNTSEMSVVANVAKNVAAGMKWVLEWACEFTGDDPKAVAFELNTEFDLVKMTPDERRQLLAEWQGGGIAWEEYRGNLRRAGVASMEDKKAQAAIKQELADAPGLEDEQNPSNNPKGPK